MGKTRIVWMVFLGMLSAMAPLSTDMYLPALPVMTGAFGVGPSLVQLTLTMTMGGMAIGQLMAGPVSDYAGRRRPLVVGMLLFTLSTVGCVVSEDIFIFLVFRFVQGFTGAFGIVTARAVARDLYEGVELTKFFSLLMLVNGLAPILAPVIGGQILLWMSWRGVFVLLAVSGVLLTLSSLFCGETLPKENRIDNMAGSFKNFGVLMGDPYFRGQCLVQFFFFMTFSLILPDRPLFFKIFTASRRRHTAFSSAESGWQSVLPGLFPCDWRAGCQTIRSCAGPCGRGSEAVFCLSSAAGSKCRSPSWLRRF